VIIDYGIAGDFSSRCFRLQADGVPVRVVETPPMDAAERQRLADEYRKLPDYCHIYDPACMHLHYAHLGAEGGVQVAVEAGEEIRTFSVLPLRRGVEASAEGRILRFASGSGDPRYFVVRINELPPLMVAIDAPETDITAPGGGALIDAGTFLSDPTGATDQTRHFERAFAAASGSGKTLRVPPGTYSVSQLHLRNGRDFQFHLAAGCLLKVRPGARGGNEHRHGLWLQDCENVSVTGRGCIDHQAYEHYVLGGNDYQHGMADYYTANELCPWITQSPLFITGSRQIRIEGITIRNGRNFNINCRSCDDLTIRHVKVLTAPACTPEYADGINTGSSRDVLVENCLVACNDDSFASGHYFATHDGRGSRNHVVRGLLGWNPRGSGVRLGFFAGYDQGDFTFERCDFMAITHASLLVHALRPKADGQPGRYGTIRVVDCTFDARRLEFLLSVEKAAIGKLELIDVTLEGRPRPGALFSVEGDPTAPIDRLLLRNVVCDGRRLISLQQVPSKICDVMRVDVE
jgi:hypothetical protein